MADASDLTTYLDAVRTAISNGDAQAARINVALAKTVIAELPDMASDGVSVRYGQTIAALESAIADLEASEGSFVFSQLEFDR